MSRQSNTCFAQPNANAKIEKRYPFDKMTNTSFLNIKGIIAVTLKELEQQLLALSPSEKVQVIQLLAQSLGSTWEGIEKTPRVCGGEARIAKTRIPIWVLVEARRLGYTDSDLLLSYPTITATDLANAWGYAEAHPDEIELAIERNEVA
ncbi:hypothetical protein NIES4073_64110 [Kalymmatonema gypsitolerans NIES-4073]|nr:hypothetical protein NIES4073_64110 [Scytonema sp. NIES-4073]